VIIYQNLINVFHNEKGHDLLHRDKDKKDFLEKSTHFPEEPVFLARLSGLGVK
jgi:hypothetical protein